MYRGQCLFLGLALSATAAGQPREAGPRPHLAAGEVERLVKKVVAAQDLSTGDDDRLAQAYRDLFKAVGTDGVRNLQTHPNDGIALQAALEDFATRRHTPEWFVGFLEGRAKVRAPDWWAVALAHGCPGTGAPGVPDDPYHEAGPGFERAPKNTTLAREPEVDGAVVVRVSDDAVRVPADVFSQLRRFAWRDVSALATPERCYLATHGDVGANYPLACLDRESGNVAWKTRVPGHWPGGVAMTGPPQKMWVAVTRQGDRIVVFGLSYTGYHVEVLQAVDGKSLFRCSTRYSPAYWGSD
jgi:hypothetical protein